MQQLQTEMNRLFSNWTDTGRQDPTGFPSLNLWEDADQVFIEAELPGMEPKDIEIHVTGGNQLTLRGERKPNVPENMVVHRQERGFGTFVRVLTLPFAVDAAHVEAKLENGVLRLKLPKHESAKPRKITVKGE